jgi:chromosome segregation ATPase
MPRAVRDRHAAANIGARPRLERFFAKAHNSRQEDYAVSDNPTRETPDSRSFEERVFARFDALDTRMGRFESRLDSLETKVDALDARMDRFESRLGSLENKVDGLGGRMTALEDKVDSRLRETRPIWEGVLARLTAIESELSTLNRQFNSLILDFFRLRVRVEKLEEDKDTQTA